MVRRTHNILQWLFAIFVLYLLISRLIISWVQFYPNQFLSTLGSITGTQIEIAEIKVEQDWLGFQFELANISIESEESLFQAEKLAADVNTFFFILPSINYGDYLQLEDGAYQIKNPQSSTANNLEFAQRPSLKTLTEALVLDVNIDRLWKRLSFKNFVISEIRPGLSVQLHDLKSIKSAHLSFSSEFSLAYQNVLDYERFSLKSTLTPNVFGGLQTGSFKLSSFNPLSIEKLSRFLSDKWQEVLPSGELILDLQGNITNNKLSGMKLQLNSQSLQWRQTYEDLPESLGLSLQWQREQQNMNRLLSDWRFSLSKIQIDNRFIESVSPMELFFEGDDYLNFSADKFDIEPFKVIVKSLIETDLAAKIFDRAAYLNISSFKGKMDWQTLDVPYLDITFDRLDLPVTDFPGMSWRSLQVQKTPEKISISTPKPVWVVTPIVHGKPMRIDLPKTFAFGFDANNQAWNLAKLDFKVDRMPLTLMVSQLNEDYIDLGFSMKVDSMNKLKEYLPYPLMSEKLQKWLQDSLVGGEDIEAQGSLRGLYKNFPFLHNDGQLLIKAKVKDAQLQFNPKWPQLSRMDAELEFKPYELKINVDQVAIGAKNTARNVSVLIPDLNKKDIAVRVSGQVETDFENSIKYMLASPLAGKLGVAEFLKNVKSYSGQTVIDIEKLEIPVSGFKNHDIVLLGKTRLKNAGLKLNEFVGFNKINGDVRFTEDAIAANNVRLQLLDGEARLNVETNSKTKLVKLNFAGEAFTEANEYFAKPLSWSGIVNIPFKAAKQKGIEMAFQADLDQAKSLIPYPFDEKSFKGKKLLLNLSAEKQLFSAKASVDGMVQAEASFVQQKDEFALEKLQVLLGQATDSRFAIGKDSFVTGSVDYIDLATWQKFLSRSATDENQQLDIDWQDSSIKISKLVYANNEFENLLFKWAKEKDSPLTFDVNAKDIAGKLTVNNRRDIKVNLDKLVINTGESLPAITEEQSSEPDCAQDKQVIVRRNIDFTGKNIIIDGRKIDAIDFVLQETPKDLRINNFEGKFGNGSGLINGNYIYDHKTQSSRLNATMKSNRVAALTRFLKINQGFTGKSADVAMSLNWKGGLSCFSSQRANGKIDFEIKDGSIEDIEPGIARLIGLLSVESLVRRLQLDLKDVTNKGMVYESIKGKASLNNNELTLNRFDLRAPSANGELTGKLDIGQKTFDLQAKITPKIGATIPTIAAIAGGTNPLAALAVYTLMKVIPNINENLVTYEYDITGPWDKPKIKGKDFADQKAKTAKEDILNLP